ncbi:Ubiquitin-like protease family profile domain-containing protein [Entamoeba marina]
MGDKTLLNYDGMVVKESDYERLKEGEMLNDGIINSYIKIIESQHMSSLHKIFNTFFSSKIQTVCSIKDDQVRERQYQELTRWLNNEVLLDKRFLLFPIHENTHWYLIVFCNKTKNIIDDWEILDDDSSIDNNDGNNNGSNSDSDDVKEILPKRSNNKSSLLPSKRSKRDESSVDSQFLNVSVFENTPNNTPNKKKSTIIKNEPNFIVEIVSDVPSQDEKPLRPLTQAIEVGHSDFKLAPCVLVIDSFKSRRNEKNIINNINEFLRWESKRLYREDDWENDWGDDDLRIEYVDCPQQKNGVDCGVYLLYFIRKFMKYTPTSLEEFNKSVVGFDPKEERKYIKEDIKGLIEVHSDITIVD